MENKKKKGFNFGTVVAIVFIGYVVLILFAVFKSTTSQIMLVEEDYYDQSTQYDNVIEMRSKNDQLKEKPKVFIKDTNLVLKFPEGITPEDVSVVFYKPNNNKLDFIWKPKEMKAETIIPWDQLKPGFWQLKIIWEYKDDRILTEQNLTLESESRAGI